MTAPSKRTDRELARSAFIGSIFVAVAAIGFGACGAVQVHRETATPAEVAVADLSDTNKVPTGQRVRVEAELRPGSRVTTSRQRTMIALVGAPAVVVTCAAGEPSCSEQGPAKRTIVGTVMAHDDTAVPVTLAQYAPKVLHLDAEKVRALHVEGGEAGFRGGYIAAFVIAGLFALCFVAGMVRGLVLLGRARRAG